MSIMYRIRHFKRSQPAPSKKDTVIRTANNSCIFWFVSHFTYKIIMAKKLHIAR